MSQAKSSTREALIVAAAKLLERGGPGAVTLREVGRRAGVSHNAPYKHFENKAALLAAIAAQELRRLERRVSAQVSLPPGAARAAMVRYVRQGLRNPARFRLTFGAWDGGTEELTEAAARARARFIKAVAVAQAGGKLPRTDPERLAALIMALAHGAVELQLSGHLSRRGKGGASAVELVGDLFGYLEQSAKRVQRISQT
jgi:AcrR family transcriptional regulator